MNIDINVLWIFLALSFGLIATGYTVRFSVPISLFFFIAGGLLFALFIMTDNIIIGYNDRDVDVMAGHVINSTSNSINGVTVYEFTNSTIVNTEHTAQLFEFTQEVKTFMVLIAGIMALVGGAVEIQNRR